MDCAHVHLKAPALACKLVCYFSVHMRLPKPRIVQHCASHNVEKVQAELEQLLVRSSVPSSTPSGSVRKSWTGRSLPCQKPGAESRCNANRLRELWPSTGSSLPMPGPSLANPMLDT